MALLSGGGVKLIDKLKDPLSGIAKKRQGSLDASLGRISGQGATSAAASGRPMGEYFGQQVGQAGQIAGRGIEDSLYDVLGTSSLQDVQNQREHEQNIALAKRIGALNKPNLLSQILSGAGQLGGTALTLRGMFPKQQQMVKGGTPPPISLWDSLGGIG